MLEKERAQYNELQMNKYIEFANEQARIANENVQSLQGQISWIAISNIASNDGMNEGARLGFFFFSFYIF